MSGDYGARMYLCGTRKGPTPLAKVGRAVACVEARVWLARAKRITGSVLVEVRRAAMAAICASRKEARASLSRNVPRRGP